MAAPSPLRFFAAWRVEAPSSASSRFVGFYLTRSVALCVPPYCSREDSLDECERTCEAPSRLFFTALWLQSNQSIWVQETQSAKDTDMTCSKMLLIKATTCSQVGPMSFHWLVDPFADPLKFPAANNN